MKGALNRQHSIEAFRRLAEMCADVAACLDRRDDLTALEIFVRAGRKISEATRFAIWTPAARRRAIQRVRDRERGRAA
jgi:hypothetical protein